LASIGDRTTHLDRTEPSLNTNLAGDPRDTTTPEAFAWTLARLVEGTVLGEASRRRLNAWMVGCRTGLARLRAGLPAGWVAGDKTGTGAGGAINDVAVVRPPGRPPVIIVCFMSGSTRPQGDLEAAQAKLARLIAASIG
jgi:beta-lactamase class A